jgi:uncharacterized iron-regulated protein
MLAAGCSIPEEERGAMIYGPGGVGITEAALGEVLRGADIVILGEIHDDPVHHARQARLVRAIEPGGIAFEMVPAASEEGIRVFREQGGSAGRIGPAIGWKRLGWPSWGMYAPVFEAAGPAYIAGGGVSKARLLDAFSRGAAVAYGNGAEGLGLDQPLAPEVQAAAEDEMIASHCNQLPREAASGMVEAQRLRDAAFTAATIRAYAAGGTRAVLITGAGHARTDRGVPVYLKRELPDLAVISVGMVELADGEDPRATAMALPYDYVWFSDPVDRGDPCAGFKLPQKTAQ